MPIPFVVLMLAYARPTLVTVLVGINLVIAGEALRLWGVAIAGSETRTTGPVGGTFLITTGPFAYVRNPLYVGNIMIYLGFGVMSYALFPWLTLAAYLFFATQYSMIVSLEELYLRNRFGAEYERYAKSVPRFLPSLRRFAKGENEQPELDWARGVVSEKSSLIAISLLTFALMAIAVWQAGG